MNKVKYQIDALGVLYEDALADFKIGAISEEQMREYAIGCLVPEVPNVAFQPPGQSIRRPAPIAAHHRFFLNSLRSMRLCAKIS